MHESYWQAIDLAKAKSSKKRVEEPDFVATTVINIAHLAENRERILSKYGITLSIASIYCHQRPIVSYKSNGKNPELGDLLIIHVHHPKKGKSKRKALLLQVKMTNDITLSINQNDHQLYLYEKWPSFNFVRPKMSKVIQVHPTYPHDGARYLMIGKHPFINFPYFMTSTPNRTLHTEYTLVHELMKLLSLSGGKSFYGRKTAQNRSDWSTLVWDLLEMSF
ncbi:hypothetical protein [Bacillus mycoides]|uniref:hypothetical protein n=1 Tax=Bacillus mycoides TaxID=1405 RepID=UPI0011EEC8AD|nr:hypothetical protein [Bacillus mycoides]QEL85889.1 hypothetical protein DN409_16495 [Bacillus mycoides]